MDRASPTVSQQGSDRIDAKVHIPVLLHEVLALLDPKPGELIIDATFGQGGHSEKILERIGEKGKLIVIDWDWHSLRYVPKVPNVMTLNENFACIAEVMKSLQIPRVDGLLLDLGLSSRQLEESGRGFSFKRAEPLLMTYDSFRTPMREVLRSMGEARLADVIRTLSGERYAREIARAIKKREKERPIRTSLELAEIIRSAVPTGYERGRIDPATRTFMAFRIFANKELENLEKVLKNLPRILRPGGRVAIISFHSGEDRLVKKYFQEYAREKKMKIITKKPIVPGEEEIKQNPRARSAKLRGVYMNEYLL